eukprot:g16856.t1
MLKSVPEDFCVNEVAMTGQEVSLSTPLQFPALTAEEIETSIASERAGKAREGLRRAFEAAFLDQQALQKLRALLMQGKELRPMQAPPLPSLTSQHAPSLTPTAETSGWSKDRQGGTGVRIGELEGAADVEGEISASEQSLWWALQDLVRSLEEKSESAQEPQEGHGAADLKQKQVLLPFPMDRLACAEMRGYLKRCFPAIELTRCSDMDSDSAVPTGVSTAVPAQTGWEGELQRFVLTVHPAAHVLGKLLPGCTTLAILQLAAHVGRPGWAGRQERVLVPRQHVIDKEARLRLSRALSSCLPFLELTRPLHAEDSYVCFKPLPGASSSRKRVRKGNAVPGAQKKQRREGAGHNEQRGTPRTETTEAADKAEEQAQAGKVAEAGNVLWCVLEKRNWEQTRAFHALRQALRRAAPAAGHGKFSFGSAGTKDKRAVTTQIISIQGASQAHLQAAAKLLPTGLRLGQAVLRAHRHVRKRELLGNRFRVWVRGVRADHARRVQARLRCAVRHGFINYYGPQRMGEIRPGFPHGEGVAIGVCLLAGRFCKAVEILLGEDDPPKDGAGDVSVKQGEDSSHHIPRVPAVFGNCLLSRFACTSALGEQAPHSQAGLKKRKRWQRRTQRRASDRSEQQCKQALERALSFAERSLYVQSVGSHLWNQLCAARLALLDIQHQVLDQSEHRRHAGHCREDEETVEEGRTNCWEDWPPARLAALHGDVVDQAFPASSSSSSSSSSSPPPPPSSSSSSSSFSSFSSSSSSSSPPPPPPSPPSLPPPPSPPPPPPPPPPSSSSSSSSSSCASTTQVLAALGHDPSGCTCTTRPATSPPPPILSPCSFGPSSSSSFLPSSVSLPSSANLELPAG